MHDNQYGKHYLLAPDALSAKDHMVRSVQMNSRTKDTNMPPIDEIYRQKI